jgi:serine/threonine protein phosphatase PrpC
MEYVIESPAWLNEQGKRPYNEDYILPRDASSRQDRMFMVCDGVGGSAKGDVASRTACLEFTKIMESKQKQFNPSDYLLDIQKRILNDTLSQVEGKLDAITLKKPEFRGMASTITYLHLSEYGAIVAWAGDSRVYQFRGGEIINQTEDHSLVNELVKRKEITAEEAKTHPRKNVILRAVSGGENPTELDVEIWTDIHPGDVFLLCTDGILEGIDDHKIAGLLSRKPLPDVRDIIKQDCDKFASDNFSMILVKVTETKGAINKPPAASREIAPITEEIIAKDSTKQSKGPFRIKPILIGTVVSVVAVVLTLFILSLMNRNKGAEWEGELKNQEKGLKDAVNLTDSLERVADILQILAPSDSKMIYDSEKHDEYVSLEKDMNEAKRGLLKEIDSVDSEISDKEKEKAATDDEEEKATIEASLDSLKTQLNQFCKRIAFGADQCLNNGILKEEGEDFSNETGSNEICDGVDEKEAPWNEFDKIEWCGEQYAVVKQGETFGLYKKDNGVMFFPADFFDQFLGKFGTGLIFKRKNDGRFIILSAANPSQEILKNAARDSIVLNECPDHVILIEEDQTKSYYTNFYKKVNPPEDCQ